MVERCRGADVRKSHLRRHLLCLVRAQAKEHLCKVRQLLTDSLRETLPVIYMILQYRYITNYWNMQVSLRAYQHVLSVKLVSPPEDVHCLACVSVQSLTCDLGCNTPPFSISMKLTGRTSAEEHVFVPDTGAGSMQVGRQEQEGLPQAPCRSRRELVPNSLSSSG